MENGSVDWLFADPFDTADLDYMGGEYGDYQNFRGNGSLAHIDNYSSFAYESDNEGRGNMALYLINEAGKKFDWNS
ncbi:MAG TPA: hypothetical protein VFD02_03180 [Syntrophomonadaceae bacterium]|nr:hypothetical protein [Syntrophomonadaceae bacterium]